MKQIFSIGRLDSAGDNENDDIVIAIDDEQIDNHYVCSVNFNGKDHRFLAEREKLRSILKSILDE